MSRFDVLDETLCKAPVCPHPQCWMTFRRLECGAARFRPVEESSVPVPEEEDRLPVLTVCNLSQPRHPHTGLHLCAPAPPLSLIAARVLGINEGRESERRESEHLTPRRARTKLGLVDVSLAPAGFQDTENRRTSLVWIPSSPSKSLKPSQEEDFMGEEPLKIGIKDFTLDTVTCGNEKSKTRHRASQKHRIGRRFPAGRCLNPSLRGAPLPAKGSVKNRTSESSAKEKHQEPSGRKGYVCGQSVRCLQRPVTGFPKPENRRLVLHDAKEKSPQRVTSPVPASVYKLDDKVPGNLSLKEVDLESIRNQYYLWKKYSSVADGSGRISTSALDQQSKKRQALRAYTGLTALRITGDIGLYPCGPQPGPRLHEDPESKGSVRSNTALSCDASFGSFSPSPRTDPDSQAVQRSSPESPCYEDVSEPAQASTPSHDTRDPLTMDPPVQTEPQICDLDLKPPEQRPPSTQPNPPPPSPTHTSQ